MVKETYDLFCIKVCVQEVHMRYLASRSTSRRQSINRHVQVQVQTISSKKQDTNSIILIRLGRTEAASLADLGLQSDVDPSANGGSHFQCHIKFKFMMDWHKFKLNLTILNKITRKTQLFIGPR